MKRIKLEQQPDSPFNQGLLVGIRLTAVAFVPILLRSLELIGSQLLGYALMTQRQPSAVEVPIAAELKQMR